MLRRFGICHRCRLPTHACTIAVLLAIQIAQGVEVTVQNYALTWVDVAKQTTHLPILLNGSSVGSFIYDGHGAISAGATSRLLYDYPEPHRGRILDMLFTPGLGAALHQLKVEIGGDSQSLVGTEPSHMHRQGDLACNRGYEFWLIREARLRNPKIVIYALSWAVPHWVGYNPTYGQSYYYSQDNIDYHVAWLKCVRAMNVGHVNFLGHRNQREWGLPSWTIQLRQNLDVNNFTSTRIVIPDGEYDSSIIDYEQSDAAFSTALKGGGVGVHFPCFLERREIHDVGLKYFSSEDWFTRGDWHGASCLGRLLNLNFIRMNVTATLARSLLWSAYAPLPHRGKSLIVAAEPWSGHYVVQAPVWTIAHTTHFVDIGWKILSAHDGRQLGPSGYLREGGTYVTYLSPDMHHFTVVVEKLHGDCEYCKGRTTAEEDLTFCLVGGLEYVEGKMLSLWSTNETHRFVHLNDVHLHELSLTRRLAEFDRKICFGFIARPDTIYTLTTALKPPPVTFLNDTITSTTSNFTSNVSLAVFELNTSNASESSEHGSTASSTVTTQTTQTTSNATTQTSPNSTTQTASAGIGVIESSRNESVNASENTSDIELAYTIPDSAPFPENQDDDFESYDLNANPRFFADFSGSWQVALDPTRPGNNVLKQWVVEQAGFNSWVPDSHPITFIGDGLSDLLVSTDAYLPPYTPPFSGIEAAHVNIQSVWNGLCIGVENQATWTGATAQALQCSPQWHEQLVFEARVGTLKIQRTGKCLSGMGCPGALGDPQRSQLCFQDCCGRYSTNEDCAGQSWQWEPDKLIRLRTQPSMCITVVGGSGLPSGRNITELDGQRLHLLECSEEGLSTRQQWVPTTTSLASYIGICARIRPPPFGVPERHRGRFGYCLNLGVDQAGRGIWQLEKNGAVVLARGMPSMPTGYWHRLALHLHGPSITAHVDGLPPATISDRSYSSGMVALGCGWGEAYFDNFTITNSEPDLYTT